jgi:hypothetical protein
VPVFSFGLQENEQARRAQPFITPGEARWFKSSPRYQI